MTDAALPGGLGTVNVRAFLSAWLLKRAVWGWLVLHNSVTCCCTQHEEIEDAFMSAVHEMHHMQERAREREREQ